MTSKVRPARKQMGRGPKISPHAAGQLWLAAFLCGRTMTECVIRPECEGACCLALATAGAWQEQLGCCTGFPLFTWGPGISTTARCFAGRASPTDTYCTIWSVEGHGKGEGSGRVFLPRLLKDGYGIPVLWKVIMQHHWMHWGCGVFSPNPTQRHSSCHVILFVKLLQMPCKKQVLWMATLVEQSQITLYTRARHLKWIRLQIVIKFAVDDFRSRLLARRALLKLPQFESYMFLGPQLTHAKLCNAKGCPDVKSWNWCLVGWRELYHLIKSYFHLEFYFYSLLSLFLVSTRENKLSVSIAAKCSTML